MMDRIRLRPIRGAVGFSRGDVKGPLESDRVVETADDSAGSIIRIYSTRTRSLIANVRSSGCSVEVGTASRQSVGFLVHELRV